MSKALFTTLFVLAFLFIDITLVLVATLTLGDRADYAIFPGGFILGWYLMPAYRHFKLRLVDLP